MMHGPLCRVPAWLILAGVVVVACPVSGRQPTASDDGEVLYNGIRLPAEWPPRLKRLGPDPMRVPYLAHPPKVIPIDVGRQLFVDDFLIQSTTLKRTFHRPEYYQGNPILVPEKPWEMTGRGPMAIPHSGGVCYDPADQLFKMWYITGYQQGVGLVYSKDGINWRRPVFDHVRPGSNMVYDSGSRGSTIWHDLQADDPARRFVMFSSRPGVVWFSKDGIEWGKSFKVAGPLSDRTTLFWNPFRKVWVYSIKTFYDGKRARRYWETPQLVGHKKSEWGGADDPMLWIGADSQDPPHQDLQVPTQLYDLDVVAYESILLGTFIIWRGDYRFNSNTEKAQEHNRLGRPKQNSACIGFSRDGFHWHRPDRRVFLPKSDKPGDWNWGNSQTAAKSPLVVGDRLYFYVTGRGGLPLPGNTYQDAGGSTGLAFLRRDGFASMDAGRNAGTLITRPVRFSGKHLFVNVNNPTGRLRVAISDENGNPIAPFSFDNCTTLATDSTRHAVQWKGADDLSQLAGKSVRFSFEFSGGELYAFWISPDRSGASHGYVAGGGPGFTSNRDTVGNGSGG
jgi:hypothetical protein